MTQAVVDYSPFESKLGYHFQDSDLLARCLFHASAAEGRDAKAARDFQRLEFLGDRVLGLGITELLLKTYSDEDEGQIARRHSFLVDRTTLASVAAEIGLGDWITLSHGERKAAGDRRPSILADCFESLLAGIYLDGGYQAARQVMEKLWQQRIISQEKPPLNPKSALQERLQANGYPLPEYCIVNVGGSEGQPIFEAEVRVPGLPSAYAKGSSKRIATTAAACAMLESLDGDDG